MLLQTPLMQARKKSPPSSRNDEPSALPSFRLARTTALDGSLDSTFRSMVIWLVGTTPPFGPPVELLFGSPQAWSTDASAITPDARRPEMFVCMAAPLAVL